MRRRILLAVDLSYQCYRCAAAYPLLTNDDETVFTGGLFGFFMLLAKAIRETGATDLVLCQDRKPYRRSLDYPEYKTLRKASMDPELKERFNETMPLVLGAMSDLGYEPWGVDGFESDDLVGHVVRRYRHRFERIYAQSNDSDLFQLLDEPGFAVYGSDIKTVMTAARLLDQTGLAPPEHMLATALTGTHNDIEGIRGVGIKTAAKAIRDPALMRKYRAQHGAVIDRNLALIRLPHPDFPGARLPPPRDVYTPRLLYRVLGRYDIDTTASMVAAFDQLQGG